MAPHAEAPLSEVDGHTESGVEPLGFNWHRKSSPYREKQESIIPSILPRTCQTDVHDVLCIGFGPAALAIAVALHDALEFGSLTWTPRVCFLERQARFAWHAGMQIPGATMQISWIKDLATIRNPRSRFTFLNYLHAKERLLPFSNLGTFLPLRREYEDYMRWCAEAFEDVVEYEQEAVEISPATSDEGSSTRANCFVVKSINRQTGEEESRRARHVIIASGGKPRIPPHLPQHHPRVIHSASYMYALPRILTDTYRPYRVAVIGAGQSAAETFSDLQSRYPNSQTRLIIKSSALRPSDDSPFVNEIFDPHRTDGVFNASPDVRAADIATAKDTNYSVVRLELLERMYSKLYEQRLKYGDETEHPHQILNNREVLGIECVDTHILLHIRNNNPIHTGYSPAYNETLPLDAVIVATGYERNQHESLLAHAESFRPKVSNGHWTVSRDYRVCFKEGTVSPQAGVWLQGCCEDTHGLSDTLLSVLASRAGEVVQSMFSSNMVNGKA